MKELIKEVSAQTMSSVQLVKIINDLREDRRAELRHKDFLEKIRKVIGLEQAENFAGWYKAGNGQMQPCYNLPKRESHLMVMSESYKVQAAVYDQWQELENAQPKIPQTFIEAMQLATQLLIDNEKKATEIAKLNTLLDNEFGYCSILRAAKYAGVHETYFKWQALKARTIQLGYEIRQVPSPRYGYQNLYIMQAFRDCYPEIDFDDLTPELVDDKSSLALIG